MPKATCWLPERDLRRQTHDKKIADQERIAYPPDTVLYKDTGFQGYEPAVKKSCQAKKKPPGGELTAAEKRTNRKLARIRVRVEHALAGVKRCRIVKDVLRNTKEGVRIRPWKRLVDCITFESRIASGD